jgi:DNA modification methylase
MARGPRRRVAHKRVARQDRRLTTPPAAPSPPRKQEVNITAAKGRPMLTWVGKRPLRRVVAFPAQHVETFDPSGEAAKRGGEVWKDWPAGYPRSGLLFHGDNKEVLAHLLANGFRGKVNLIYIDPPFDSGADYVRKVSLRGPKGTVKLDGQGYTLGEQLQYTDIWANDNYLQFMYERLLLLKELLATNGAVFLHVDPRRAHHVQSLMDEVFGQDNFQNSITWKRSPFAGSSKARAQRYPANHDVILFYTKTDAFTFLHDYSEYSEEYLRRFKNPDNDPRGPYRLTLLKSYSKERFDQWQKEGRLIPPKAPGAGWSYKQYLSESKGVQADDFWDSLGPEAEEKLEATGSMWSDINLDNPMATVRTDYPTQKPEELVQRIISCCSTLGDLILDCFIGSGTTAAVAQRLGRRWIGCDINKGAIQTTSKRLQSIMQEQIEQAGKAKQIGLTGLRGEEEERAPEPAQLSLAVYRVNDYDLAIQHEEAVHLACEHIGVTRTRTDRYFDGTLGRKLVKIVPFSHALTLLDLEELKRELDARPGEDRAIVLVCLGKEPASDAWMEDWNRLRKGKAAVNRMEIIELRTDPKYGKFFQHQPARAKVKLVRKKDALVVEIEDFISPSIIARLQGQDGLLKPKIDDWRSMVDCVMIDPDYDGKVFRVGLSDVPERKTDVVAGRYEIPAGRAGRTVGVKIIDMLGEEVLATLSTD